MNLTEKDLQDIEARANAVYDANYPQLLYDVIVGDIPALIAEVRRLQREYETLNEMYLTTIDSILKQREEAMK